MRAVILAQGGAPEVLQLQDIPDPEPGPGQARVRLKAAGLNHRDIFQRKSYAEASPTILGSDGAGVVDAAGEGCDPAWVGREVVINPSLHWGDREDAYGPDFQILGVPTRGTYAEAVVVPGENLVPKPDHLSFVEAAALPLAGLTAWRGLFTRGGLTPGGTVLLPGIGGGVAGFALMFAKAAGARVIVTSSSREKLDRALAQGADGAVDYTEDLWEEKVRDLAGPWGIDMVLDHSGEATLPAATRLVRPGGSVVFLGVTTGVELRLNIRDLFFRQVNLKGTYMGSPREFQAMMQFVAQNRLRPEVHHVYKLAEAARAHAFMEAGAQYGKIILEI